MNLLTLTAIFIFSVWGVFGQSKTIDAAVITAQINAGRSVSVENAVVTGELDLTRLGNQTNDAVYPENGRSAKVFSNKVVQTVSFKNVRFTGGLKFFRAESDEKEIREYRVIFEKAVAFENCVFEKETNFELTNFDGGASFADTFFKQKPRLVRIGLQKSINLEGTVFEQGSVFQFTQTDTVRNFSAEDLKNLLKNAGY